MFSICIPVYNCNINELVNDLILQLDQCKFNFEIVVIDDFSKSLFKKANTNLKSNEKIVYIELEKNIGRSAIRNLFIKYTRFENLIFLDCDSKLLTTQFIGIYRNAMLQNHKVVCGGRDYLRKPKERKYKLRWKYGLYRECKTEGERNKNPYRSFMTNNFLIHKSILKKIKFEERIKGYGHEDTLFGYQLMKSSIPVKHIDNQTIHLFDETSSEFLQKTKQGIQNLYFIHSNLISVTDFVALNLLLQTFIKVEKWRLKSLLAFLSYILLPKFALLFRLGIVPLKLFDIYKLLYLCRISRK